VRDPDHDVGVGGGSDGERVSAEAEKRADQEGEGAVGIAEGTLVGADLASWQIRPGSG